MKNIQTGNEIVTLDPYRENHAGYAIEASEAHDGYKASIRDLKATAPMEISRGWPCIDDALLGLEGTPLAKEIKWYSPQYLGV